MANKDFDQKPMDQAKAPVTEAESLDKEAKFKAAKKEAAKRFAEKRAEEKKLTVIKAGELLNELKKAGVYDKLSDDLKAFVEKLANPSSSNGAANVSVIFKKMFGDTPKVGATITLMDAFKKTLKDKASIDAKVKKWKEKGTIVTYKPAANPLESTYVLEAIGSVEA